MSDFFDDYRDDARRGAEYNPDAKAEREVEQDNLEAIDQARRDRLADYADHDWTRTA